MPDIMLEVVAPLTFLGCLFVLVATARVAFNRLRGKQ